MAVLVLFPVDFVIFWGFGGGEVQTGFVYFGVTFRDIFPCGCLLDCFIIFVVGYLGMFSWMARYFGLFGHSCYSLLLFCFL